MSDLEPATPGQILAKQRDESERSLREVADALNLPISTLEDIEADALDRLPAQVYTRGYVRAYARHLQLDPEPIVAALAYSGSNEGQVVSKPQQTLFDLNNPNLRLSLIGCAVFLVVVAVWSFLSSSDDSANIPNSNAIDSNVTDANVPDIEAGVSGEVVTDLPKLEIMGSETIAPATMQDETTQATSQTNTAIDAAAEEPRFQISATDQPNGTENSVIAGLTEVFSSEHDPIRRLTATGNERLQFAFTEECWVEIKNTAGATLYGDLGRDGVVWEFVGEGPFQLLLGYSPGVTLRFNTEQISLVPHTRNNVARLVLGQ